MDDNRKTSENILHNTETDAPAPEAGHLKIFFGYAAGVGKTYSMLKAAHAAKQRGIDVVVGYMEPHIRPQTTALLEGLPCLAPLVIDHRGKELHEFDLDGAIARAPKLILVDELAHTNIEGCRHAKRYQDVLEMLKAGIDVYTTVNVQHIESLNDMVASITGVLVKERIPDRIFDDALQVELVDIEPSELIERLKSGKIYRDAQAQQALGNFFSEENLVSLREIALRRCADRVNKISEKSRVAQGSNYYTDEHILVCLSPSPSNAKIIRTAARMADAFKGNFTALFVETANFISMSEADKNSLRANIALAVQLGASIETVYGDDVAFQISEFARLSGVSKIVVGRNNTRRKHVFGRPSLTERLAFAAPNLDIYIIPDNEATSRRPIKAKTPEFRFLTSDVLKSIGMLVLTTLIGFVFYSLGFSEANIIMIYILGVLLTAIITTQKIYSLISSLIGVLTFNFFFTVPRFSLAAYDSGYPVTFLVMFISAFITSSLAIRIKQHATQSAQTAYRTKVLLETNRLLQKVNNKSEIISITAKHLTKLLDRDVIFYAAEKGELLEPTVFLSENEEEDFTAAYLSKTEKAVATWVYKNNRHAGATTDTLGSAKCLYLAARINDTVYGVVGINILDEPLDSFENSILLSILGECALALENEKVRFEREEASSMAKNEQLRANLLRSISHDLRTPLTSISGNASILLANEDGIEREKRKALYTSIYDDSLWLIDLVENLLSVTRIEDGSMHLHLEAELMEEIISEALLHINRQSVDHNIVVQCSDDFLMAKMDAHLIVQVLINIVDNAIKYTPLHSTIVIDTTKAGNNIIVKISDDGEGISAEAKDKIFEMFFTAVTKIADGRRSLGLGLALCKSIITAHGGTISVCDNNPRGTVFTFTLPAQEVLLHD